MHTYNDVVIIVVYADFILFWFYHNLKLSLGWAGVTWSIEWQCPECGSIPSWVNPWKWTREPSQESNQRVTKAGTFQKPPLRLNLVHVAGDTNALYLSLPSFLLQVIFCSRTCLLLRFVRKRILSFFWANGMILNSAWNFHGPVVNPLFLTQPGNQLAVSP